MWLAFGAVHLQAGEAAEELAEAQADVVRRGVGIARKGTEEGDAVARRAPGSPLHGTTLKRGTVAQTEKLREKRDYRNPFKTHTTNTATASNASFTRADLRV
ncbi:uncharacterized protein LOC141928117 isoform X2 [Strix aluco]|uniref:uncharacterized protein LOC141928117 isoform X2 n=1 Tax=Strix aluco TaxID=111821 RepID=UPI003DA5135F